MHIIEFDGPHGTKLENKYNSNLPEIGSRPRSCRVRQSTEAAIVSQRQSVAAKIPEIHKKNSEFLINIWRNSGARVAFKT